MFIKLRTKEERTEIAKSLIETGIYVDTYSPLEFKLNSESLTFPMLKLLRDLIWMEKINKEFKETGASTVEINVYKYGSVAGKGHKKNSSDGTRGLQWGLIELGSKDEKGNYRYKPSALGRAVIKDIDTKLPYRRFSIVPKILDKSNNFVGFSSEHTDFRTLALKNEKRAKTEPGKQRKR